MNNQAFKPYKIQVFNFGDRIPLLVIGTRVYAFKMNKLTIFLSKFIKIKLNSSKKYTLVINK